MGEARPALDCARRFVLPSSCSFPLSSSPANGPLRKIARRPRLLLPATPATVTPAATTSASAIPVASTAPVAACAALEWDKTGDIAKATSFKGKIDNGEGSNATDGMEKLQTLVLDKPACGPDKAAVPELQLYTNEKSIDLKKMVGKTVTIEGEPFAAHTAHHHTGLSSSR